MNNKKLQWSTVKRKVNDLIPYNKNPRKMSEKQIDNLKKSFKLFNLVELPAIDIDGKIIAGHMRIKVLQLLNRGEEIIEVRMPNRKLSKREYDQYLLTSNAVHGDWEYAMLKEFDIDVLLDIGFSDDELSHIWDENLETEDDNFNLDKELKKTKTTKIKIGDKFQLGKHVLLCDDSTNPEVVKNLMGKQKANMIYSDPPFNVGLDYDKGIGGKKNYGGKVKDNKSDKEYKDFLTKAISNGLSVCHKDAHIFNYCDQKYVGMLQEVYKELKIEYKRTCLWVKNGFNVTPQTAFNKMYEPCIFGAINKPYLSKAKNLNEILNKEVETGNRAIDDILDMLDIWLVKRLAGQDYSHPTEKPTTLHEKPLRRCTKVNDVVLDMFLGSGSTLLSCEMLKRRCYGIEINPIFCQLIINRFESYANIKAKKIN